MRSLSRLSVVVTALLSLAPTLAAGAEIRTYQFKPDGTHPYRITYGESSGPATGMIGDVSGAFTVSLDLAAGKGTLLHLDDELVNLLEIVPSPNGLTYQPKASAEGQRILSGVVPSMNLPLEGLLEAEGDELVLAFDGQKEVSEGMIALITSFAIRMKDGQATFSMEVPLIETPTTVTSASATLIPEPHSLALAALALAAVVRAGLPGRGPTCH